MFPTGTATTSELQAWIAVVGGLATAILGLLNYFRFRSKSERQASVGEFFRATVEALSSEDAARKFAGAILLRRFFDPHSEQGGRGAPYAKEARGVIAALLRDAEPGSFQKVLADGLGFATTLKDADLQHCHLQDAYLGTRPDRTPDLSAADLYRADLSRASLRGAKAVGTVFYRATLRETVLVDCDLRGANFVGADLEGARLTGAIVSGADFSGAKSIPANVEAVLLPDRRAPSPPRASWLVRVFNRLRRNPPAKNDTRVRAET